LDISDNNIVSGPPAAFEPPASPSIPQPRRTYAFIDFELSAFYPPSDSDSGSDSGSDYSSDKSNAGPDDSNSDDSDSDSDHGTFKVTGDVTTLIAPEMSATVKYDPFKADIWQMGTLLAMAMKVRALLN
jgi:hypothetical protein